MHVRKGDRVVVLVGQKDGDKGKKGKVIFVSPKDNTVIVENVNIQKHHKKARSAQDTGGIIDKAGPISSSNVQIICPKCELPTRVAHEFTKDAEGKEIKIRICKKCGASLDKAADKKAEKKTEKAKPVRTRKKSEEETAEQPEAKTADKAKEPAKKTAKASAKE